MLPVDHVLATLLARRAEFTGFLASRLGGNQADAEDVLQHGLVKALTSTDTLRNDQRLVPWFYQLLRHAVIDHVRSRRAAADRERRWTEESLSPAEVERHLCACLDPLLATLPPAQATLLRRCELADSPESVTVVAESLGITPNAASVTLHRARANLREKLRAFCGDCASRACLDCHCEP